MKAREFGALSECPRCGEIAYHWMTEPKWPPIPESVEPEGIDWNTSNCKVVRTCKNCSHDWGEE